MCHCSDLFKQLQEEQQVPEAETAKAEEVETVAPETSVKGKKSPPSKNT